MRDRIDEIGKAAGEIWMQLEGKRGGMTVASLKNGTQLPVDLLHEALGWLAREDKVRFVSTGKGMRIMLR
jgi:hypothetical protein